MALGEKALRGARNDALLLCSHTEFGKRGEVIADRSCAHFDKRKCIAVVTDQIQFTFGTATRRAVPRYKNISKLPQIQICKRLAPYARSLFACAIGRIYGFAFVMLTAARLPANDLVRERGKSGRSLR